MSEDRIKILKDITNECTTRMTKHGYQVHYMDVPLWMTLYPEDPKDCGTKIQIVEEFMGYTILGKTPIIGFSGDYDYSTYGDWESEEEVEAWLADPTPLY